jgi:hypothetical protein
MSRFEKVREEKLRQKENFPGPFKDKKIRTSDGQKLNLASGIRQMI